MKSRKLLMGIFLITLVFGIMLTGCDMEPDEPTYSIYTRTFIFSSTNPIFGDLPSGYYKSFEITRTDFNWERANNFQNVSPSLWTEDQIISFLISWGFDNATAKQEASRIISFNHFMIGVRDGSNLRLMIK